MAKMIPSVVSPEIKSNAEKKIFEWFRDDPDTEGWVVIHSLGISNHTTVLYGELDFFVLAPKLGIFALEVKGGRVSRNDGVWMFTDKYNNTNTKTRGPFEQANEGMFSLIEAIKVKYGVQHRYSRLLCGTGVMFPDIVFNDVGTDGEQWQVFDSRNLSVSQYIKKLAHYTRKKWEDLYQFFPEDKLPTPADIKELTKWLRADFDKAITIGKKIDYAEQELIKLTNDQLRCIDQLEDNPRCLIKGAAGTGKTLLAIEEVKKAVALGEKVALFCFNNQLGIWLKQHFAQLPEELRPEYVGTIHAWLKQVVDGADIESVPTSGDMAAYYYEELPNIALDALEANPVCFDRIVIDEAQDIIGTPAFYVIDEVLKKGLERGKWVFFGDFTRQAIYNATKTAGELEEELEDITSFIRFKLKTNCRNTKFICDEIKTITGFDSGKDIWNTITGISVDHSGYAADDDHLSCLEKNIRKLLDDGIKPDEITILSPNRRENSVVSQLSSIKIKNYSPSISDTITFSTIHAFKGLENKVIIMVDIDSFEHEQLMYVGLSRARVGLFIIETQKARKEYLRIIKKRLFSNG